MNQERDLTWLWLVPLLLFTAALAVVNINKDAIWYDEYWSLFQTGGAHYGPIPPTDVWARVAETSVWPPAYHLTLSLWQRLAGSSVFAGRFYATLYGLLAVAWTYRLGVEMASRRVGWVAAVLLGGSAYFIFQMHEYRGYTLYMLVSVFSVWVYWRAVHTEHPSRLLYAGVFAAFLSLLYIHFFAILTGAVIALYHLFFVKKDRRWWTITGLAVVAVVLFVPWIAQAVRDLNYVFERDDFRVNALDPDEIIRQVVYAFSNGSVALVVVLSVYALRAKDLAKPRAWAFLLAWVGLVVGLSLLVNAWAEMLTEIRYILTLWPALSVLCALGVVRLAQNGLWAGLVLAVWLAAGVWNTFDPAFMDNTRYGAFTVLPWNEFRETLEVHAQEDDAIAFHRPDNVWAVEPLFEYYTHGLPGRYAVMETLLGLQRDDEYYWSAKTFLLDAPRAWVVVDKTLPPNFRLGEFERALADDYAHCRTVYDDEQIRMELYARAADEQQPTFVFGNGRISVASVFPVQPPLTVHNGTLYTTLGITVAEGAPLNTYSVAVHVLHDGELVTQADFPLPEPGFHCAAPTVDVSDLPPGDYTVQTFVYAWETGDALLGSGSRAGASTTSGNGFSLGTVSLPGDDAS